MYYIEQADKPIKIEEWFNIVKLKNNRIILPNKKEDNIKIDEIFAQKTKNILDKTASNKIILSKNVHKKKGYINYLYSYNYDIVDGKWLFKILLYDVLEYIIMKENLDKDETQISIMLNDITERDLYNIKKIITNFKKVNIITNHLEKFKNLEEKYKDIGIVINVGNNKRKGILKSKIILNLDFPSELVNKYNIYDEAIIVNFQNNVKIKKKRYNGICINDYEIDVKNCNDFNFLDFENYYKKELYEGILYKNQPIEEVLKKLKIDGVVIEKLVGVNNSI